MALKIHIEPLPEGLWADGNRLEVFEELYRRCHPQLVELCRRMLPAHGDAEALAQEAFIRAWLSLDRFSGARPFWPWVATIARRLCIDYRRRQERETRHVHVAAGLDERPPVAPDEMLEADEEYRSALLALQRLKPAEQRVITLRDVNGWSYDEIAKFEGVTVESIRGSLKRARASLRQSYAKVAAGVPAALGLQRLSGVKRALGRAAGAVGRSTVSSQPLSLIDTAAAALVAVLGLAALPAGVIESGEVAGGRGQMVPAGATASAGPTPGAKQATPGQSASSAQGARSQEPDGGASSSDALLVVDSVVAPEDAVFSTITASPSYDQDHTVYAVGTAGQGCSAVTCPVLFKSTDAGASWARLPANGFTGGTVMLPPSYATDRRIFVAGPVALSVSSDGGQSFDAVTPMGGPAAISPQFQSDRRILLGHAPGWEYVDGLDVMRPSGLIVNSTSLTTFPAFSPRYAMDRLVFIGATTVGQDGKESAVFRCQGSVCGQRPAVLTGLVGSPSVAVSPALDRDGRVMAWRGDSLFRSDDGGSSFARAPLPVAGAVRAVAFDQAGRILVAVRRTDAGSSSGGLLASSDGGQSWQELGAGTALSGGVEAITALPDGRILAGLSGDAGRGVLCSTDGGSSWSARCAD